MRVQLVRPQLAKTLAKPTVAPVAASAKGRIEEPQDETFSTCRPLACGAGSRSSALQSDPFQPASQTQAEDTHSPFSAQSSGEAQGAAAAAEAAEAAAAEVVAVAAAAAGRPSEREIIVNDARAKEAGILGCR